MPSDDFPQIDRDRLRARARRFDRWTLLTLFDRAIEHVPDAEMAALFERVLKADVVAQIAETSLSLLEEVQEFNRLSRKRHFYESIEVNWKNCNNTSQGTEHWFAECERLLRRCAKVAPEDPQMALEAFEILFDSIRALADDIVFFADEGGSYLLTPGWDKVLPAYFKCLAPTTSPKDYARRTLEAIDFGCRDDRLLRAAHDAASPEQRQALPDSFD